jgi:hypothetical protein
MINVLNGILKKDTEGPYNGLGNISRFLDHGPAFGDGITEAIQKFQKTLQILDDIDAMESGRS